MKSIAVIAKYYPPFMGGIENVTAFFAEHTAKKNVVHVYANNHEYGTRTETNGNLTIFRLHVNKIIKSQPISIELLTRFDPSKYDAIHFHGPNPFAAFVLFLKMYRLKHKPKIYVTHHADIHGRKFLKALTDPLYTWLQKNSAWVSATSPKNAALSRDIHRSVKPVVIPLCIDTNDYKLSDFEIKLAHEWRSEFFGSRPLIGYIGRHARYKGIDVLLNALKELDGVCAVIAGDGPLKGEMEKLALKNGIQDRVLFTGLVSEAEKKKILSVIDVFAFPSTETSEAFGIGQLEAMRMGAIVVASNLPTGVTDVSIDNVTAILAEPNNPADLARKIQIALFDKPLRDKLRLNASEHVMQNFERAAVEQKIDQLIEQNMKN
ncbi:MULTISPECIES: glycosyltransferase [unclassified Pannonibacter]|uniref:glycosyltransferase n=1 Tax=unclassified Pannonibacter TaxID=2627228 RepID=UPI001648465F|nr:MULTISPECIES: glycosyltransferase [unclassified Pannonibacter]